MRYMGGKTKVAKKIVDALLSKTSRRQHLIEPFMGGGAMTAVLAPHFEKVEAYDVHEDLIMLWEALACGWEPPSEISETFYQQMRNSEPSALRGFVGFGTTWGAKWFGGYAKTVGRNYAGECRKALLRDIEKMKHVHFDTLDYCLLCPSPTSVVYADPPYAGTTGYVNSFDSKNFWDVMNYWASCGVHIFVSEYNAPSGWNCIWECTRTRVMKADLVTAEQVTEKLFTNLS